MYFAKGMKPGLEDCIVYYSIYKTGKTMKMENKSVVARD
jgi:hypothetical protein